MIPTVSAVPIESITVSVVGESTTVITLSPHSWPQPLGCLEKSSSSGEPISTNAVVSRTSSRSGRGASRPVGYASTSAANGMKAKLPSQTPSVKTTSLFDSVSAAKNHR